MKRYRDYTPTAFDCKGLGLPDRQDWLVAPVIRTRDSGVKAESNFEAALEILGGESKTVEVHCFNHWGPGWFEIILVHPSREKEVEDIERALEDYPLLDDEDFSSREYEAACDYWDACSLREKIRLCAKFGASIFSARQSMPPSKIDIGYLAQP